MIKPTEKRVNSISIEIRFNFTKKLEAVKVGESWRVQLRDMKDRRRWRDRNCQNDKDGNVKLNTHIKKGQRYNYTVEEVLGTDATVTYDTMRKQL